MSDENIDIIYFIIGSSPFIVIYPWIYLYNAYSKLRPDEKEHSVISFETLAVLLPIFFGIGVIFFNRILENIVPRKLEIRNTAYYPRFIISGTITSLTISLLLHYGFHIQDRWLHMDNPHVSHLIIPLFYFIVFATLGIWLRAHILYGPSDNVVAPSYSNSPMPQKMKPILNTKKIVTPINLNKSEAVYNKLASISS